MNKKAAIRIVKSFVAVVVFIIGFQVLVQLSVSSSRLNRIVSSQDDQYYDIIGSYHGNKTQQGVGTSLPVPRNHGSNIKREPHAMVSGSLQSFIERQYGEDRKCNDNLFRPENPLKRNSVWHIHKDSLDEIMVYAAFYDDRPIVGLLPWIRMHTVAKVSTTKQLYCHIWYNGIDLPFITEAIYNKTGRNYDIKKVKYGQSLLSCKLPRSHPIPSHVSIATSHCGNTTMLVPIEHLVREEWTHEFGVCVAIAFGSIPASTIVEWIEFHNMLGVTEFNVYDGNMKNMSDIFNHYQDKGLLRVHKMPPAVDITSYDSIKLNSPASLNDCMLRNMYRYRWILVIDFDEFLIPRIHGNYADMLQHIDQHNKQKTPHHTYSARNAYFFRDFSPDTSQPNYLLTAQYRTRIEPSKFGYAPKSFINPRQCLSAFNHYCYIRFPNTGPTTIDISTKVALSHHYRKCGFGHDKCSELYKTQTQDDIALVFKIPLRQRVESVLRKIGQL